MAGNTLNVIMKTIHNALQAFFLCLLYMVRAVFGKALIRMHFRLWSQLVSTPLVLKALGATVGKNCHIYSDICIYNAKNYSCKNLSIGSNVHIGPRCVFDLTSMITIEDDVSISAQVSFTTHIDVGNRVLRNRIPRNTGPITIKKGSWIGANCSILHNVTVGEYSLIGAMSLVNRDILPHTSAFGIPCRVFRKFENSE